MSERKRSPEEILRDIEEAEIDDAAEQALAMTPEERRKEFEAAGFDLRDIHAKADAWHARMRRVAGEDAGGRLGEDGGRKSLHPRVTRERVVLVVAAVAVAAIFVAFLLFPWLARNEPQAAAPRESPSRSAGAIDASALEQ